MLTSLYYTSFPVRFRSINGGEAQHCSEVLMVTKRTQVISFSLGTTDTNYNINDNANNSDMSSHETNINYLNPWSTTTSSNIESGLPGAFSDHYIYGNLLICRGGSDPLLKIVNLVNGFFS